jgi:hypothetical protein
MTLSILIPTIARHRQLFGELAIQLLKQITPRVEILIDEREGVPTGTKRNDLLQRSAGRYTVFIDSDDKISDDYITCILDATIDGPDAICFEGIYTENNRYPTKFKLSKDYGYEKKDEIYYRYPNHIVPIKRSIATQFKFPDVIYGEDYPWATAIHQSGLIQTEVIIPKDLYYYRYINYNKVIR